MFVAIPLLGELGWLLRRDPADDWVSALPARPAELAVARTLHLLTLLWSLALASLLPATLLAHGVAPLERALFPIGGLGVVTLLAACLLAVQSLLGGRAEALLVAFQTLLVVGVVVGLVVGLRHVPALAALADPHEANAGWLWAFPPAWFALPLAVEGQAVWPAVLASALALGALVLLPPPSTTPRHRGEPGLARILRPVRALATRVWVRKDERAAFDLVYDALPREREVVLRTYPMIGIPLAFLVAAASGPESGPGAGRADLLTLLLFTTGIYLPILLTQIPASASFAARWLHETAPVPEGAIVAGTIKAVAVRFLLPLYVVLGWIGWMLAGPSLILRLALPAALVSLQVLRRLYPVCVSGRPLSTATDELRVDLDWLGVLGFLAVFLTLLAILASRLATWPVALVATVLLVLADAFADRRLRRELG